MVGGNKLLFTDGTNNILWPGVAWNQNCQTINGCDNMNDDINTLNCDKLRISFINANTIVLNYQLGNGAGVLENGSYFACIAYTY